MQSGIDKNLLLVVGSIIIDKNLLLVVGSIRNVFLCVKNILPQDVGCVTN
jgi:hypothetical protein